MQALFTTDLKVHHKYTPKQMAYLNYGAAASEVSILFELLILYKRLSLSTSHSNMG